MTRTADASFAAEPTWRGRLFALARVVLFIVLFVAANFAEHIALKPLHRHIAAFEGHALLETAVLGIIATVLTILLSWLSSRKRTAYGLGGPRKLQHLAIGAAAGIGLLTAQLLLMHVLGVFDFGAASPVDANLLSNGLLLGLLFVAVGYTEETLFRGYVLVELSRALSFWPAAVLLGALFGIPHWLKAGESMLGGAEAAAFAVAMAYTFQRTGSLWLAFGYHAAWDYGESFVFGVPDSGTVSAGRLLHPIIHGPQWLSGGTAGPEGSILAILPAIAIFVLAWLLAPARSTKRAPLL